MSSYVSGLLTTLLVLNQSLSAAPPISNQVKHIQTGAVIQVHMADGRTLEGKLVSNSQQSFDLLEEGHESAETIECSTVVSVNKVSSPRKDRKWVTVLLVGGVLAATGVAIAVAGRVD